MKTIRIWLLLISIAVIFTGLIFSQETIDLKITDIEKKLTQVSGKERIEILLQAANAYESRSLVKMLQYSKEALTLARKFQDRLAEVESLYLIGAASNLQQNDDIALEYLLAALTGAEKIGSKKFIAKSLNALGVLCFDNNDYVKALDYYLRSLKIMEELGEKNGIAAALNNIGAIYEQLEEYETGRKYYERSLKIRQEQKDNRKIARCYRNIGELYRKLKKFNVALGYFQKSLKICEEIGNDSGMAITRQRFGNTYNDLGDYKKALDFFSEALKSHKTLDDRRNVIDCMNGMGYSYMKLKNYRQALSCLQASLNMALENKDKIFIKENYVMTAELYENQGDFQKALEYFKLQMQIEKELFDEVKSRQMKHLQIEYDVLKKNSENERLLRDNELQKLRLDKAKFIRNASIAGFGLVLVILLLLFRKYLYLFAFWKKEKYIGRYRLLDIIGAGGMSVVYKAHSIKEKTEKVAVKILKPEFSKDDSIIKRFKQEAVIIDKLDHPNIVKVFERGEDKNRLFMAMEYLDGKTLTEKIARESPIPLPACLHIMNQLADALSLIHAQKIIHRDLKPSNIVLLCREGDPNFVKLLDFGLARTRFQSTLTKTGELLGTISYMSPEQLLDKDITTTSDIYSLGVVFYETVYGQKAFTADNEIQIIKRILDEMPTPPVSIRPEIPLELNRLILQMLDKDPGRRPSLADFRNQLRLLEKPEQIKFHD